MFRFPRPLAHPQVESCGTFKDIVGVANHSYTGVGKPSVAQVHNGDVGGHRDRTSDGCFPKQEKRELENRILRDPSSCHAEDSSQGQSLSPSQENRFLPGRVDPDSEKDGDDSLTAPCKKRGRRKLERPTKCELWLVPVQLCHVLMCSQRIQQGKSCACDEYKMLSNEL